jgi:aromatic-L-amino-acid decarboxylase
VCVPVPLEPDADARRVLDDAVVAFASTFLDAHADAPPVRDGFHQRLRDELAAPPPEDGERLDDLLALLGRALGPGFDNASGRFLGYVPSGGLYAGALGSYLGAVTNQYTGGAHAAPGAVAIEESVLAWMASLFGLPTSAGGLLLSGGSLANLTAVVAARSRLGEAFGDGVVYTSERAHHSVAKAARIAGIAADRVRAVGVDPRQRLDSGALGRAVAADAASGLRPMLVVATAGTTDTGAIDPLAPCADVAAAHDAWFHVDAAYGGFFTLTDRGRERLAAIDRADSITVDAHKSLLLPFGIGGLLVRDPADLVAAHEGRGAYMQDVVDIGLPHYLERGPELTRPNRGLPVWLALHLHGIGAFRAALDRMLDLAEHAAARLAAIDGVTLVDAPALSILAFRAVDDDTTWRVQRALNESGEVYVSSTTVDGRVHVRVALLSQRTTRRHVDGLVDVVAATLA